MSAEMLAQCVAAPADDGPRLVWADAIGGERGELVVLQCDLARGGLTPAEVASRRRRERELLARHGAEWAGLGGLAQRWTFHRGFVEAVRVDLATLAGAPDKLFEAAPLVTALSIGNLAGSIDPATRRIARPRPSAEALGLLGQVIAGPAMKQLRALDVIEPAGWVDTITYPHGIVPLADDVAALLSAYGVLGRLQAFGIAGGELGPRGLDALGAVAERPALARLWLRGQRLAVADLIALLGRLPDVVELDVTGGPLALEELAPIFARPLISLATTGATLAGLAALARSPAAQTLEHLALLDATFELPPTELEAFPRLRSLELSGPGAWPPTPLPALRELALAPPIGGDTIDGIAAKLGATLEVFDVRSTFATPDPSAIAGEALVAAVTQPNLLHPTARVALGGAARSTRNELSGMPAPTVFLVGTGGGRQGGIWEVPALDTVRIGRHPNNDLAMTRAPIAPYHAVLRWSDHHYHLTGLQGSDTRMGGLSGSVRDARLVDGARFKLGHLELVYFVGDGAADRVRAFVSGPPRSGAPRSGPR